MKKSFRGVLDATHSLSPPVLIMPCKLSNLPVEKVYNLCCKSAKAARLFLREGIVEYIASLLAEMRATEGRSRYHPQVHNSSERRCNTKTKSQMRGR